MFNFKIKKYLKRTDLINSVNSDKIWSKSLTMPEIKELLEALETKISKHKYTIDKNFLMDGRRSFLKSNIEKRFLKGNKYTEEDILESLFNFWEFVNNEYHVITPDALHRYNLTREKMDSMCMKYTKKEIICLQEKDAILEMIQTIKNYILNSITSNQI